MEFFNTVTNIDFSILDFIFQNIRCAFLDPIMAGLSYFGEGGLGWIVISIIMIIPRKTRVWGCCALAAMLLCALSGELLIKNIVCRLRPFKAYEAFHGFAMPFTLNTGEANGYSFPSGHTSCSFAAAIVYFKGNKRIGIAAIILATLVGFSRLYNYVHFPTDVICGMILGAVCAIAVTFIFKKFNFENKLLPKK